MRSLRVTVPAMACLALAIAASSGCVKREMTIDSDPTGATVFVDGEELGVTPITIPFVHYGVREVRLEKEGFQTTVILQPINAPAYQVFPLDFIFEVLVPFEIQDKRYFMYGMDEVKLLDPKKILERAKALQAETADTAKKSEKPPEPPPPAPPGPEPAPPNPPR